MASWLHQTKMGAAALVGRHWAAMAATPLPRVVRVVVGPYRGGAALSCVSCGQRIQKTMQGYAFYMWARCEGIMLRPMAHVTVKIWAALAIKFAVGHCKLRSVELFRLSNRNHTLRHPNAILF